MTIEIKLASFWTFNLAYFPFNGEKHKNCHFAFELPKNSLKIKTTPKLIFLEKRPLFISASLKRETTNEVKVEIFYVRGKCGFTEDFHLFNINADRFWEHMSKFFEYLKRLGRKYWSNFILLISRSAYLGSPASRRISTRLTDNSNFDWLVFFI